jgi:hypothetical protein
MSIGRWILLLTLVASFYNVGTIWLMQVLIYPLWGFVGGNEWASYHAAHWQKIRYVVFVPAGLALVGAVLLIFSKPADIPVWSVWPGLGLQVAMYAATVAWWAPMQVRLQKGGNSPILLRRLIGSHWVRTGLITLYGALVLWMMDVSFGGAT